MQAVRLHGHGGTDQLRLEDVPLPRVGEQDVLVRVHFCGLNHSDLNLRRGTFYGLGAEAGQVGWRQTPMRFPLIPGSDIAGVVAAAGAVVSGPCVGDPVVLYPYVACGQCPACLRGDDHLCPDRRVSGFRTGRRLRRVHRRPRSHRASDTRRRILRAGSRPAGQLPDGLAHDGHTRPASTGRDRDDHGRQRGSRLGVRPDREADGCPACSLWSAAAKRQARILESGADAAVVVGQDDLVRCGSAFCRKRWRRHGGGGRRGRHLGFIAPCPAA